MSETAEIETPMVVICAWCPDKAIRDAEAKAKGAKVSHTICAGCLKKMEAML